MSKHFFLSRITGANLLCNITLLLLIFSSLYIQAQDNTKQELLKEDLRLNRLSGTFIKTGQVPGPEHTMLDQIIGRWINEGQTIGSANVPAVKIVTSDVYEWAPGGFFVIHYAYGYAGKENGGAIEIIGYDKESKKYVSYCFDSNGILTLEELMISKNAVSSLGKNTRCNGVFSDDGNILTVHHERSEDGGKTWLPTMDVKLVKIK
jgi:hypothetical protein